MIIGCDSRDSPEIGHVYPCVKLSDAEGYYHFVALRVIREVTIQDYLDYYKETGAKINRPEEVETYRCFEVQMD